MSALLKLLAPVEQKKAIVIMIVIVMVIVMIGWPSRALARVHAFTRPEQIARECETRRTW